MNWKLEFALSAFFLISMALAGWHAGGVAWNG